MASDLSPRAAFLRASPTLEVAHACDVCGAHSSCCARGGSWYRLCGSTAGAQRRFSPLQGKLACALHASAPQLAGPIARWSADTRSADMSHYMKLSEWLELGGATARLPRTHYGLSMDHKLAVAVSTNQGSKGEWLRRARPLRLLIDISCSTTRRLLTLPSCGLPCLCECTPRGTALLEWGRALRRHSRRTSSTTRCCRDSLTRHRSACTPSRSSLSSR